MPQPDVHSLPLNLGHIVHDMKNLLTGVIGYTELVQADLANNALCQSHLDEIMKAGVRLSELVHEIEKVDLSAINALSTLHHLFSTNGALVAFHSE